MNNRILLLSLLAIPMMSFAMEDAIDQAKYAAMNRTKAEKQKEYNEFVEKLEQSKQDILNQTTILLAQDDYKAAEELFAKLAEEQDKNLVKKQPKKLTRLTKTKGQRTLPGFPNK